MNKPLSCNKVHLRQVDESMLTNLTVQQVNAKEANKCCQCAYNSGYQQGSLLQKFISLDIDSLGESAANSAEQYKSVHQAFALGYSDGVNSIIKN